MKKADLVELMLAQDEKDKASLADSGVREVVKAPRKDKKKHTGSSGSAPDTKRI